MYEAYVVSISCCDFDILLMSSLTIFESAGETALQGHSKCLAILHQGANRAIMTGVKLHLKEKLIQITTVYLGKKAVDEADPSAPKLLHERVHVELDLESSGVALHTG